MSRSEQSVVREMCQSFLHDDVPEYIRDTAYAILSDGGVQKINIQEGDTWEVQGGIQGEDLQVYTPSLSFSITDHSMQHQCNCSDAFTGICRHVAALALRLQEELRKSDDTNDAPVPAPVKDWKQSFRAFFSTDMEPEAGRHYLIFRFSRAAEQVGPVERAYGNHAGANHPESGLVRILTAAAPCGASDRAAS